MRAYKDVTDFLAEHYLQVNICGIEGNPGPSYNLLRPKGRKDYYLFYVASGWIEMEIEGKMTRIDAGKSALCRPNVRQLIFYPSDKKLVIYYLHFTGTTVEETMGVMQQRDIMVTRMEDGTLFEVLFRQLIQSFLTLRGVNTGASVCAPKVNGLLLQLLELVEQSNQVKTKSEQESVMSAMLYIGEHFREEIDLEKCASDVHLSLSRFAHLFTQKMGISPHKFVLSLRIDEAKELLKYSSMSISEISKSVGFADASYFARLFRKYTGCTPTEYRLKA